MGSLREITLTTSGNRSKRNYSIGLSHHADQFYSVSIKLNPLVFVLIPKNLQFDPNGLFLVMAAIFLAGLKLFKSNSEGILGQFKLYIRMIYKCNCIGSQT